MSSPIECAYPGCETVVGKHHPAVWDSYGGSPAEDWLFDEDAVFQNEAYCPEHLKDKLEAAAETAAEEEETNGAE